MLDIVLPISYAPQCGIRQLIISLLLHKGVCQYDFCPWSQMHADYPLQAYLDRYKFEHHVVAGAVDEPSNVAFSMHQDKVLHLLASELLVINTPSRTYDDSFCSFPCDQRSCTQHKSND